VKVPDALPPGSWRVSWDEVAGRTDATRERLQRLAAHAEQGQTLVNEDVVSHAASDDVRFRRVWPVALKRVSRDVVVHEAERA
jgi:class 3 adenylate cyclase